jgi:hypothetical protein
MRAALLLTVCITVAAACVTSGRSTQSATAYSVEVANQRRDAVQILFSDGGAERQLGTLGPGAAQRFTVNTLEPVVTIVARGTGGRIVFSAEVGLSRSSVPNLTIR